METMAGGLGGRVTNQAATSVMIRAAAAELYFHHGIRLCGIGYLGTWNAAS